MAFLNDEVVNNLVVKKYTGSNWELVGSRGFNTLLGYNMDFGFNPATNEPYIIYEDYSIYAKLFLCINVEAIDYFWENKN